MHLLNKASLLREDPELNKLKSILIFFMVIVSLNGIDCFSQTERDTISVRRLPLIGPLYKLGDTRIDERELLRTLSTSELSSMHAVNYRSNKKEYYLYSAKMAGGFVVGFSASILIGEKTNETVGIALFTGTFSYSLYSYFQMLQSLFDMNRELDTAIQKYNQSILETETLDSKLGIGKK
ncbi:MAG: hypothetical protein HOD43_12205 [Candidatus Marinimicrobia bacterium]|jgi:hypothetical protein|nr:hypothetical protein [Candidatus Neomarinimicrobiota bacterium]MBT3632444.1 hypothetical protein [Candidatus Neomarinimicrobiota bacterium]MBT3826031.1 hypothetical protein [Candidatus Neomarinimicrobiota bacterium]MBT4296552.1 hypothetical protein [Candidatus Neomarinimicrobiota bacterium]MBT4992124.1 hypothetical protein [Candidatus Neomarinimicrobiota bacterium]